MNFEESRAESIRLENVHRLASRKLNGIGSRGATGLTPDSVKASPEWRAAKLEERSAFLELRNHNRHMVQTFKKELAAMRHATRSAPNTRDPIGS